MPAHCRPHLHTHTGDSIRSSNHTHTHAHSWQGGYPAPNSACACGGTNRYPAGGPCSTRRHTRMARLRMPYKDTIQCPPRVRSCPHGEYPLSYSSCTPSAQHTSHYALVPHRTSITLRLPLKSSVRARAHTHIHTHRARINRTLLSAVHTTQQQSRLTVLAVNKVRATHAQHGRRLPVPCKFPAAYEQRNLCTNFEIPHMKPFTTYCSWVGVPGRD